MRLKVTGLSICITVFSMVMFPSIIQGQAFENPQYFSTYFGGSETDVGFAIALDRNEDIIITGGTDSIDFPVKNSSVVKMDQTDIFLSKLTLSGNLVWSRLLGGSRTEYARSVAIDSDNNILITGLTASEDFPTLAAESSIHNGGFHDAFVTKFSSDGGLLWSTYLGGEGEDYGYGIITDSQNNAIVTGMTSSSDFPTKNGYNDGYGGSYDLFMTKFSPEGSIIWSSFFGFAGSDGSGGINVDSEDNIILVGNSYISSFDSNKPSVEVLIAKFSSSGALLWNNTFGGEGDDFGNAVEIDNLNNIIITGFTESEDFPAFSAFDMEYNGGNDAFVAKFNSNGDFYWASFLGGNETDTGIGIALDEEDDIFVTGYTASYDFPSVNSYVDSLQGGKEESCNCDSFVTKFYRDGDMIWSRFLGGSDLDQGSDIAIAPPGDIILLGHTLSEDFPVLQAFNSNFNGVMDIYLTKTDEFGGIQAHVDMADEQVFKIPGFMIDILLLSIILKSRLRKTIHNN